MNKLLILNMKMYMNLENTKKYIENVNINKDLEGVIIAPTSIYLNDYIEKYSHVAIQNICPKDLGAYTGCINAKQAKEIGCEYAIVGHSECREYLKEDDELLNEKVRHALNNGLKVILCVGITKEEHDKGLTYEVLKRQVETDLKGVDSKDIVIAYEPIFSIGTGIMLTNEEIDETIKYIKTLVSEGTKVVYGGSVNKNNIDSLDTIESVDGFMVGSASTKVEEVMKMIKVVM